MTMQVRVSKKRCWYVSDVSLDTQSNDIANLTQHGFSIACLLMLDPAIGIG